MPDGAGGRPRRHRWCCLLLAVACCGAGLTAAEVVVDLAEGESLQLTRLTAQTGSIRIDGRLDEPVWATLPAYDEFIVIEPDTLTATRYRTLIRIAYDDRGLYIGADMEQPRETLIKRLSGRDAAALNRDSINLTLDTSGEGRYGFWFGLNLGDSISDGTVLPERNFVNDWDGPWYGRSLETDTGWSAEMLIPWSTLAMPVSSDIRRMGLYMSRKVAHVDERWGWPALPDTTPKFLSALQPLELAKVAPRQQYNLYPFVALSHDRIEDEQRYRVGADLFWRPSSNFQLNATVNPDFGNVESDEVVVNLSATEVFFPEKRLFFLEGQEVFFASPRADTRGRGVGLAGAPYTMLNTRRIGGQPRPPVTPAGVSVPDRELLQPVDLLGAAKVTGQAGGLRYGALAAFEEDQVKFAALAAGQPRRLEQTGSDYGVGRLLYEDRTGGAYRALGVLATAALHKDRDALAQGLDFHYLSADGKWKMDGQVMRSDLEDLAIGYGGFVDFEYTLRQGVVQRLGIEYFDEDFDINDLGFLQRNDGYRLRAAHVRRSSDLSWARNNELDIRGFVQKNLSEGLLTGAGLFIADRATFDNLSVLTARFNFYPEQYDDLNSFGNGTYRIEQRREVSLRWDSDSARNFSYGVGLGFQEEHLGGDTYTAEAAFNWRPSDRLNLQLAVKYLDRDGWLLHQEDRNFTTFQAEQWQPTLSADYFLSARQQLRISLQWVGIKAAEDRFYEIPARPGDLRPTAKPPGPVDSFQISQLSFQARYRWELAPLSELFLVYTRLADRAGLQGDDSFQEVFRNGWHEPLVDVLVLKLRYRLGS